MVADRGQARNRGAVSEIVLQQGDHHWQGGEMMAEDCLAQRAEITVIAALFRRGVFRLVVIGERGIGRGVMAGSLGRLLAEIGLETVDGVTGRGEGEQQAEQPTGDRSPVPGSNRCTTPQGHSLIMAGMR
ncbi:hypothetical protein QVG61_04570 [Thiohalobacter sp. IOR34]|uniref:hypothetical protein n=1 Tax=Thiohalobacter sp. IOR34 TaxID=3057176 RepID=UPI0025B2094D|nr:hypothetical protein [Thiohalobacter sp. IOR34]WJW76373.1 hypothetical protein QVG61_04570 [Thiohalobacter sp. IOR34]